jgi:hypothetical protein
MQLDLDLSEVNVEGLTAKFESLEPEPVEEPVPPPPEVDEEVNPDMVTISYLTRAFPTVGYMSDVDVQKIAVGDWLTFTAIAGLEDMTPYADGKSGEVQAINGTQVQFNLDLSEADTSGMILTALPSTETGDGGGDVDPPDPGDATGTITAFSMANPTEVTMDSQDEAMLTIGETITLEALSGDEFAQDLINGLSVPVLSKDPVTLDIDLSAVEVAGLTADFVIDAGAPVPAAKKKGKADKEPAKVKVSVSKEKELPIPPAMSPQEAKKSAPKIQPATTTVPWGQPSEPIEETKESQHQQGLELPTGGGEPPTTKKK